MIDEPKRTAVGVIRSKSWGPQSIDAALSAACGLLSPKVCIRKLVDELLRLTHLTGPPFDPFVCARALNITVCERQIEEEGFLTTRERLDRFDERCHPGI